MNQNLWIFVCTHGKFGEELIHSSEMIAGEVNNIYSFSLLPGMAPEDYAQLLETKLKEAPGPVLCLIDLFGGTPCNICASLSKKYDVRIMSGVNLSMYIEITSQKDHHELAELMEIGMDTVRKSCKDVLQELNNRK